MEVVIDAMGGDYAPQEIVAGAVVAARTYHLPIVLVGDETRLREELTTWGKVEGVEIHHASQVIGMNEAPGTAVRRKPDSSIVVGVRLLREKNDRALVTAGNTGAAVAAGKLYLGTVEEVPRPGIGILLPVRDKKWTMVIDAGGNVDCQPEHLVVFARLASLYMSRMLRLLYPRVGLLNIGEEEGKGNALTRQTYPLLQKADLNFIGNVDAKDVFGGVADVIVCDGFSGNLLLKIAEGFVELFWEYLHGAVNTNLLTKIGGALLRPALQDIARRLDYSEYGGALLLGLNGVVVICHGRSRAKAILNAVRVAQEAVERRVVEHTCEVFSAQERKRVLNQPVGGFSRGPGK